MSGECPSSKCPSMMAMAISTSIMEARYMDMVISHMLLSRGINCTADNARAYVEKLSLDLLSGACQSLPKMRISIAWCKVLRVMVRQYCIKKAINSTGGRISDTC